ncbi:hypothetical protein OAH36_01605 [Verrucomicrobia bacterium]|nr:hypothetical protein [Verrucomicrobiota bacterium]MDB4798276.1 hypothetical protein [Verrucomicrobiota bacterium]
MKSNLHTRAGRLLVLILWFFPSLAWAQWQTATYEIKAGYNGIYLFVDASHAASLNALLGSLASHRNHRRTSKTKEFWRFEFLWDGVASFFLY